MRHVEFCLTEIECEIEADAGFLDLDARLALGVHIAGMREVLESRRRAWQFALSRCEPIIIDDVLQVPVGQAAAALVTAPEITRAEDISALLSETTATSSGENTSLDGFDACSAAALAAAILLASPTAAAVPEAAAPAPKAADDAAPEQPMSVSPIITPPIPARPNVRAPIAAKPRVVSPPAPAAIAEPVVSAPATAEVISLASASRARRAPRLPLQRMAAVLAIFAVLGVIGAPHFTEVQAAAWQSVAAAQARLILW